MAQSRYLFDVFNRHQVQIEGLKAQSIEDFDQTISDIDKAVLAALAAAAVDSIDELDELSFTFLLEQIQNIVDTSLSKYIGGLNAHLAEVAQHETEFTEEALTESIVDTGRVLGVEEGEGWRSASNLPVAAVGLLLAAYLETWKAKELLVFEGAFRNAYVQSWSTQQFTSYVRGTRARNYTDGLLGKLQRDAAVTIRTATQHVSNSARVVVFEKNAARGTGGGDAGILSGYRWVSVLDNRTSQICRSLDGRVFEYGKGPIPPAHPNCRSTIVPEFFDSVQLREDTTRDSMFGPVAADLTYYEWLLMQPASFQDLVLGPTRGALLRNGGLTADEFARLNLGRTFKPLTLEEMRRRWPQVFERAGL